MVYTTSWCLPHKIRVVFDCSSKYQGISLNDVLMQGPDLTSSLLGVLIRFRQDPFAFMADIKGMFHQVRVPESDRDLLRFLWWSNGDTDGDLEEYQMAVHLFGAISSPSCVNFALRKNASSIQIAVLHQTSTGAAPNLDPLRSLRAPVPVSRSPGAPTVSDP